VPSRWVCAEKLSITQLLRNVQRLTVFDLYRDFNVFSLPQLQKFVTAMIYGYRDRSGDDEQQREYTVLDLRLRIHEDANSMPS
jgi:hypothetical protein